MTATNQNQTMSNYKKYSLEQLENWIHDVMSCDDVTAQEIYDKIYEVVTENYYHHKYQTSRAYDLICLLNGNGPQEDKVVKWQIPVEVDELTGECYINFPNDLLEAANLKEGDRVKWIDNGNGSFTLSKV